MHHCVPRSSPPGSIAHLRAFVTRRCASGAVWATLVMLVAVLSTACGTAGVSHWTQPAEQARSEGDLTTAIALYEQAVAEAPKDQAVKTRLALLLVEQGDALAEAGDHRRANERYERAWTVGGEVAVGPDVRIRQANARRAAGMGWEAEAEALEKAWDGERTSELARRLALGWDEARELERALPYYEALVERVPDDAPLVLRLAQIYESGERLDDAAETYRAYLALEPGSVTGRVALAGLEERRGNLDHAESLLREAAESNAKRAAGWRQLLRFYRRIGDEEGVADVEETLEALAPTPRRREMRPLKPR